MAQCVRVAERVRMTVHRLAALLSTGSGTCLDGVPCSSIDRFGVVVDAYREVGEVRGDAGGVDDGG